MKYSIIGDEDTVLGFAMVGIAGKVATNSQEAMSAFETMIKNKEISIIIITEKIADMIRATVNKYLFTVSFPLIVEIPDRHGRDAGRPGIKQTVNNAIGIKL